MDFNKVTPEMKEAFASMAKDPAKRQALAEIITEYINPNHVTNTYMSLLMNTRSLQAGDLLRKVVRKGIRVYTLVPGAVHLASEITLSERANFVLDGAGVKVHWNQWEMERGDIGSVGEISREMRLKLQDYYFNKMFTALTTVWNASNTPDNYTNLGGPITATALKNAIEQVNYDGGGARVIIGTRRALQPITEFGAFWSSGVDAVGTPHAPIQSVLEEIHQTGWVGRFMGVPVVGLDQIFDNPEDYNPLLPEDKILVVGNKVGEFITYGDVKTKSWTDWNPTPPEEYLEIYQQFGMLIDNAKGIYVIEVTNS